MLWNEVDLLQLHVQETLVWVSVVPFIRPMKLNIEENTDGRDRFTARCRIITLTQAFLLPSATLLSSRSGFPLASVPPPPSRCLAAVLQYSRCYSRCYSQTVCTTFQPSLRAAHSSPSWLGTGEGRGLARGGGASRQTA